MKTIFKIGDKVRHTNDPTYIGTVTKIKNVPAKGFSKPYQWLYLDNSEYPSGSTSENWILYDPGC